MQLATRNYILTIRQITNYDICMKSMISLLKVAADETRVRILVALSVNELCVCQITELLELASSTVSRHLSILHGAGLVNMRKSGKWVYYRLAGRGAPKCIREILKLVIAASKDTEAERRILKRLKKVSAVSLEDICGRKIK